LNIIAQNCQSLNISTKNSKTSQKILALTNDGPDIILLSDIRLNSNRQHHAVEDLRKQLEFKNYLFLHNSPHSSRGTGILINRALQISVLDQKGDLDGNIMAVKIKTGCGLILSVISIYGPNNNDENFYKNLQDIIQVLNCEYVICIKN
jgi:exonuclease III